MRGWRKYLECKYTLGGLHDLHDFAGKGVSSKRNLPCRPADEGAEMHQLKRGGARQPVVKHLSRELLPVLLARRLMSIGAILHSFDSQSLGE
jgi:hypothetical protein